MTHLFEVYGFKGLIQLTAPSFTICYKQRDEITSHEARTIEINFMQALCFWYFHLIKKIFSKITLSYLSCYLGCEYLLDNFVCSKT